MKNAREIGEIAKAAGHEVVLMHRDPPADVRGGFTKWWFECSCGASLMKKARVQKVAVLWAAAHVAEAAAAADEEVARSGIARYRYRVAQAG